MTTHVQRAYERLRANPGMTVVEAVESTRQQRGHGPGLLERGLMFFSTIALAAWTVTRHHKTKGRH